MEATSIPTMIAQGSRFKLKRISVACWNRITSSIVTNHNLFLFRLTGICALHHSSNLYRQPVGYKKVTSGTTCERITSKTECEEAARQLGEQDDDDAASEETSSGYPPYCYLFNTATLYMNNAGSSPVECSSNNICICKADDYVVSGNPSCMFYAHLSDSKGCALGNVFHTGGSVSSGSGVNVRANLSKL